MTAYAYIVECADGTLYSGWTNDLEKRVAAHNAGQGAKYTRSRRPVTLKYYEEFEDKNEALRREAALKKLSRAEKQKLIEGGEKRKAS
ncbi:MAG: GIY-YIG nuclease family protein [Schwartzia sp.]|nr:GIY-YIG nuclease family protein [Schwartzia sp. (in: firmicutes)]